MILWDFVQRLYADLELECRLKYLARTEYGNQAVATLFGDHSHSMRCRFRLSDPGEGLMGGGIGQCQVSDGSAIDAQF